MNEHKQHIKDLEQRVADLESAVRTFSRTQLKATLLAGIAQGMISAGKQPSIAVIDAASIAEKAIALL